MPPRRTGTATYINSPIGISPKTFKDLDALWDDLAYTQRNFNRAENLLVKLLATTNQGLAEKLSRGPVITGQAARRFSPITGKANIFATKSGYTGHPPFGIPVRRLTGAYYRGWKVRKLGNAVWMTFNDSREAFFIEYGINPRAKDAIPRPIRTMSAIATLRYMEGTRLLKRFASMTIAVPPAKRGQFMAFVAHETARYTNPRSE